MARSRFPFGWATPTLWLIWVTGCVPAAVLDAVQNAVPDPAPFVIVGMEDTGLMYAKRQTLQEGEDFRSPTAPFLPTAVYLLDLTTLDAELVAPNIPGYAWEVVGNRRWVAWEDRAQRAIIVRNIGTGVETAAVQPTEDQLAIQPLALLSDDRLLVLRVRGESWALGDREYEYVVRDMQSSAEQVITDVAEYGSFAVAGDFIAFMNDSSTAVEPIGLEWTHNIDLVDLRTSERRTIAPDIRSSSDAGLSMVDGRVIWQEYKRGGFESRIVGYDIAAGQGTVLADNLGSIDDDPALGLLESGADSMLFASTTGSAWLGETVTLELRVPGNGTTPVAQFASSLGQPFRFEWSAHLAHGFVVWTDPFTGVFLVYDLDDGRTQRFDPTLR